MFGNKNELVWVIITITKNSVSVSFERLLTCNTYTFNKSFDHYRNLIHALDNCGFYLCDSKDKLVYTK